MRSRDVAGMVALMIPLGASALMAQGTFEGVVTYQTFKADAPSAPGGTLIYSAKGAKIRMDMQTAGEGAAQAKNSGAALYDASTGVTTVLIPSMKAYMTMNMRKQTDSALQHVDSAIRSGDLKKTGSETVAGVSCDDYQSTDAQGQTDMICVAHGMGNWMMVGGGGHGDPGSGPFASLIKQGFFPLKLGKIEDGKTVVQMVATHIERKTLDPSLFTVPTDYKDMSAMGGMMMTEPPGQP